MDGHLRFSPLMSTPEAIGDRREWLQLQVRGSAPCLHSLWVNGSAVSGCYVSDSVTSHNDRHPYRCR
jgi:hypothetical protein